MFFGDHGAGLYFTEMPLNIGFIRSPVPFWRELQIADIVQIRQSDAMNERKAPGHHNRRICRGVVETAGILHE